MTKRHPSNMAGNGFRHARKRLNGPRGMSRKKCQRLARDFERRIRDAFEWHHYRQFGLKKTDTRAANADLRRLSKAETADLYFMNPHARLKLSDMLIDLVEAEWAGKPLKKITILHEPWHTDSETLNFDVEAINRHVRNALVDVNGIFVIEIAPFRNRYKILPDGRRARIIACHVHGIIWDDLSAYRWTKIGRCFAGGLDGSLPIVRMNVFDLGGAARYILKPLTDSKSYSSFELDGLLPEERPQTIHMRKTNILEGKPLFDAWLHHRDRRLTDVVFGVGDGERLVRELFRKLGRDYVAKYAKGDPSVRPPWLGGAQN